MGEWFHDHSQALCYASAMTARNYALLHKHTAIQTSLFDFTFDPPKDSDSVYVNSLAFYDLMPKYVFNSRYTKKRKGSEDYRTLQKVSYDFTLYGKNYTNIITPARITRTEKKNGKVVRTYDIDLFPGKREQVIEWAARIAAKRGSGTRFLDAHAGAEFNLYQLQQICAELGHKMSYAQLREGLMVCMMCNIQTVCESDGDVFTASSAIFPFGAIQEPQGRSKATRTYAAFHPFVTAGITKVEFRQIDIKKANDYPGCIDRWPHLKLMHDYRYVDGRPLGPTFNLNASTIIACSGAGPFKRKRAGFAAVREAVKRLETGGDIEPETEEQPHHIGRGQIDDITFNIRGTRNFTKMMKASLAARKVITERYEKFGSGKAA